MLRSVSKGNLSGPMTQRDSVPFKTGWISLAIIGLAILIFGLIVTVVPASSEPPYMRAIGANLATKYATRSGTCDVG